MRQEDKAASSEKSVRRARWLWLAGLIGVFGFLFLGIWIQRAPLAENFIGRQLDTLNVRARYDLIQVGVRTQRIENVIIGDPRNPDLTAEWVEFDLGYGGIIPRVANIRAGGVRMRGKLTDNGISLGEIDKFRGPDPTTPFSLPDITLMLGDARMKLDTPYGQAGIKLDGNGELQSGFKGKLAVVMPTVKFEGCEGRTASAYLDVAIIDERPRIGGPIRMNGLACSKEQFVLARTSATLDLILSKGLDKVRGQTRFEGRGASYAGSELGSPSGTISIEGDARALNGQARLSARRLNAGPLITGQIELGARWSSAWGKAGRATQLAGTVNVVDVHGNDPDPLSTLATATRSMPVGPLVAQLARAVREAGDANVITADWSAKALGGVGEARVTALRFDAESGGHAVLGLNAALTWAFPTGGMALRGGLSVSGGGLPTAALTLKRANGSDAFAGQLFLSPYAVGRSKLAAEEIRFVAAANGTTRLSTVLHMDGPLGLDGSVRGLVLPIEGQWDAHSSSWSINDRCTPVRFSQLHYASLVLGDTRTILCPVTDRGLISSSARGITGGALARSPKLTGRLGSSALALNASNIQYLISDSSFRLANAHLRLGTADTAVRISAAELVGRVDRAGIGGTLSDGGGTIGAVPLVISNIVGKWRFDNGRLSLAAGLSVDDTAKPFRFRTMRTNDFRLTLRDSLIQANGTLRADASGIAVASVKIVHALSSGDGSAVIDVSNLAFDDDLQPDSLTPLALGIVANVFGTVNGQGRVGWTQHGVTSGGEFTTTGANLAAAFGPVEGVSGTIHFNDLLNLATPPRQELHIASINPGVPVTDGIIHYQLLPESRVQVEDGRWPFAGGTLLLEPATIDLSAEKARRLTLRVDAVDAAAFLQQFAFENINATGIFDGILPLVFDADGGRIEGGQLAARPGGGGLAYIGELTKEDLGVWGNYAFQTLRSIKYRTLTIVMNGHLDGEMVTAIKFTGLGQGDGAKQNFLTRKIAALPIIFNVNIRAPFRQLVSSAKSFYDPSVLIEANLPALMQAQERATNSISPNITSPGIPDDPVQHPESEKKR